MKELKDFTVVLHNRQKQALIKQVRSCVSPAAACRVAQMLWGTNPQNYERYWASLAWEC